MNMPRVVEPEWLDHLPADDPRAMRSRGDLGRVNRLMSATRLLGEALDPLVAGRRQLRIVELGAGDGSLLLRLARSRANTWPPVRMDLLDMQPIVAPTTLAEFSELGWTAKALRADVFDWLHDTPQHEDDDAPIIVANLFMHHFEGQPLSNLLHGIAARARAFVCVEPRRSTMALSGSRLLGVLGCNAVTRHDAVVSVRAGFVDGELSAQWPADTRWNLSEGKAGLFSHRFVAART